MRENPTREYLNRIFKDSSGGRGLITKQSQRSKRRVLIQTGMDLISIHGYRAVSVGDIAREAGVSTGSFYTYFETKERFYEDILDQIETRAIAQANRVIGQFRSPMNKLKSLYRFITLGLKRNVILRGVLTGDKRFVHVGTVERLRRRDALLDSIGVIIRGIIDEGIRKREFRTGRFANLNQMLISLYNALLLELTSEGTEELIEDILLLIERGLRRRLRLRNRDRRLDRRHKEGT